MQQEALRQRGKALDELQARSRQLQQQGKAVPPEWQEKTRKLAEATDAAEVTEVVNWMYAELPPAEYMTEEITWQTFEHFSSAFLDRLTTHASRQLLLTGKQPIDAVDLMREILAIPAATESPIIAMSEFSKIRARALTELPGFKEGVNVSG